jgi:ribonucleoside-diphosphate reductase alpha chain
MLIAMCLHQEESADIRLDLVKRFYNAVSDKKISLPTPIMGGVRTPTRQFSSCTLIEAGDSLDEINAAASAIVKYASQRAGIGINAGMIRALGSPIRGGEATHTGCIPFYKYFLSATKSCSQGGIRNGAATLFYPWWHEEVESLLVLKNNKGTEDNRVRHMDYGIQFNRLAYERLQQKADISLFSPNAHPELYEKFFKPNNEFKELYEQLEADPLVPRKTIKAADLFVLFANERSSTGRIYLQNVDHSNSNSPFDWEKAPVKQSNLCLEVLLPTKPLQHIHDNEGEIALCTLAAFNLEFDDDIEEMARVAVRALDNLLDYQDYPVKAAEKNKLRRTLGIGVINYAYWLAKNGLKYSDSSANQKTHELFEKIQYSVLRASNELAQEKGQCELFDETSYSQGVLPIDRYNKNVDSVAIPEYKCDWEELRQLIKQHGLRNSTLTALMPAETSSKISNATNGIEPVRDLMVVKGSKDSYYNQIVPDIENVGHLYERVWDTKINHGYLELVGIMQKFVDQSISANTNYDPRKYEGGKVSLTEMLQDILYAYKLGVKTLYYHNTRDGSGEDVGEEANCDSCTI